MRLLEKRAATVILLMINTLLIAVVVLQMGRSPHAQTPPVEPSTADDIRLDLPVLRPILASLDSYQEIGERPLFWSERRVVRELSAVAADAAQTVMPFVLLGVVSGTKSKALLGKDGGKVVNKVSVGDVVDGWRIEAVNRQGVVLVSGNVRRELQMAPGLSKGK